MLFLCHLCRDTQNQCVNVCVSRLASLLGYLSNSLDEPVLIDGQRFLNRNEWKEKTCLNDQTCRWCMHLKGPLWLGALCRQSSWFPTECLCRRILCHRSNVKPPAIERNFQGSCVDNHGLWFLQAGLSLCLHTWKLNGLDPWAESDTAPEASRAFKWTFSHSTIKAVPIF